MASWMDYSKPYLAPVIAFILVAFISVKLPIQLQSIYISLDGVRSILSVLVTAQASVLAIIFSIMLFGMEISSSQYYPFSGKYYLRAPIFRVTFLAFIYSITLDVIFLANISSTTSHSLLNSILWTTSLTAVVIVVILFIFIQRVITLSSPIGLLDLIEAQKPPRDKRNGIDSQLYAYYTIVQSAISQNDPATAREGLERYRNRYQFLVQSDSDISNQGRTDGGVGKLYDTVFVNHLPSILLKANTNRQTDTVDLAIREYVKLCKVSTGIKAAERQSYSGLQKIIQRVQDDDFLVTKVWSGISDLLVYSSKQYTSALNFHRAGEDIYSIPLDTAAGRESVIEVIDILPTLTRNVLLEEREFWGVSASRQVTTLIENVCRHVLTGSDDRRVESKLAKALSESAIEINGRGVPSSTEVVIYCLLEASLIAIHRNENRMYIWVDAVANFLNTDNASGVEVYFDDLIEGSQYPIVLDIPEYTPFEKLESHSSVAKRFKRNVEAEMDGEF